MPAEGNARGSLIEKLKGQRKEFDELLERAKAPNVGRGLADDAADLIIALNSGEVEADKLLVERLLQLASATASERLRTVAVGTLWREDIEWLSIKTGDEETARERLLRLVAQDKPKSLAPVFWRAVAERGPRFTAVAFRAAEKTHPHEAARLVVELSRAALRGQYDLDIRTTVDDFLAKQDSSVRTTFLEAVKRLPETEKRNLMNHLDMSLMAALDKDALEHRGKSFFYDEDAERKKREEKGKDIFDEVRKRLERGDKPQF
jgi:hypothetical protein